MMTLLAILSALLLSYLAFGVGYQLFYALCGLFYRQAPYEPPGRHYRIAVLLPAYREDAVILSSAKAALEQDYPAEDYTVWVIADSLQEATLAQLRSLPAKLLEVAFEKSTKSKALNKALEQLPEQGLDLIVLLDADNVMAPDFLRRIAAAYHRGFEAIQGQRAAKNLDTPIAVLDGAAEYVNNHILCKGHRRLGLSARLAGSGMAFDYALFRRVMPQVDAIGGFDKELELRLVRQGIRIAYDDEAIVYDEKVRREADFSRQRSRWIAAQFHYARRFFPLAVREFFRKGNVDFLNKAVQMLLPPRLLTPGLLLLGGVVHLLAGAKTLALLWALVLVANLLSFFIAMPPFIWKSPYRQALWGIPRAFFYALKSMLYLKYARRNFINTPHGGSS